MDLTSFSCFCSLAGACFEEGCIYLSLEYMDCGSLQSLFEDNAGIPLAEPVLADVALQLVQGLATLHADGHVHRDIKPHNVLINSSGHVKLTDFGIMADLHPNRGRGPLPDAANSRQPMGVEDDQGLFVQPPKPAAGPSTGTGTLSMQKNVIDVVSFNMPVCL